jgi:hypothetical protein
MIKIWPFSFKYLILCLTLAEQIYQNSVCFSCLLILATCRTRRDVCKFLQYVISYYVYFILRRSRYIFEYFVCQGFVIYVFHPNDTNSHVVHTNQAGKLIIHYIIYLK